MTKNARKENGWRQLSVPSNTFNASPSRLFSSQKKKVVQSGWIFMPPPAKEQIPPADLTHSLVGDELQESTNPTTRWIPPVVKERKSESKASRLVQNTAWNAASTIAKTLRRLQQVATVNSGCLFAELNAQTTRSTATS